MIHPLACPECLDKADPKKMQATYDKGGEPALLKAVDRLHKGHKSESPYSP